MRSVPRPARVLIVTVVAAMALVGCTGGQASHPQEYGAIST